jgi:tetratricopeptide (TPR) repeat protein
VSVQLNLFSAERLKVGEGFEALVELDLDRAGELFDTVLARKPEVGDARAGQEIVAYWQSVMEQCQKLDGREQAGFIWQRIKELSEDPLLLPSRLKRSLIGKVIALLQEHDTVLTPPDLCCGYLYTELGEYQQAVASLKAALERSPDSARLRGFLGDALWCLGRETWARAEYARALLTSAGDVSIADLRDPRLLDVISHYGLEMAPVYGWLKGVLPLLDPGQVSFGNEQVADAYRCLFAADQARLSGDQDAVVERRQLLRESFPDLFAAYMKKID